MISIDEFSNVELKIGKVISAERVINSEKLLRLIVDLGEENQRQIIAGIGKAYEPEVLIGKEIVVVANLAPRMMMGLESQGMVLAVGNPSVLLMPEKEVPPGSLAR